MQPRHPGMETPAAAGEEHRRTRGQRLQRKVQMNVGTDKVKKRHTCSNQDILTSHYSSSGNVIQTLETTGDVQEALKTPTESCSRTGWILSVCESCSEARRASPAVRWRRDVCRAVRPLLVHQRHYCPSKSFCQDNRKTARPILTELVGEAQHGFRKKSCNFGADPLTKLKHRFYLHGAWRRFVLSVFLVRFHKS